MPARTAALDRAEGASARCRRSPWAHQPWRSRIWHRRWACWPRRRACARHRRWNWSPPACRPRSWCGVGLGSVGLGSVSLGRSVGGGLLPSVLLLSVLAASLDGSSFAATPRAVSSVFGGSSTTGLARLPSFCLAPCLLSVAACTGVWSSAGLLASGVAAGLANRLASRPGRPPSPCGFDPSREFRPGSLRRRCGRLLPAAEAVDLIRLTVLFGVLPWADPSPGSAGRRRRWK